MYLWQNYTLCLFANIVSLVRQFSCLPFLHVLKNHRIIESFRLEKTFKISEGSPIRLDTAPLGPTSQTLVGCIGTDGDRQIQALSQVSDLSELGCKLALSWCL